MYKVFLADDEIVVREGIRNNFPMGGNGVLPRWREASDGEMALSMLQDIKPDILITDIRMPFMDGLELCRTVSATMPWMYIIIISGHDDFTYAREAISIGVKEYLLKPVSVQELKPGSQTHMAEGTSWRDGDSSSRRTCASTVTSWRRPASC